MRSHEMRAARRMGDAANAGGRVIHFTRDGARVRNKLGNSGGGDIARDDQGRGRIGDGGDRVILRERIEARSGLLVQSLAHGERIFSEQERIAVRLRGRHVVPSEVAIRARPIFHHDGLAERLLEVIRNLPGQGVGRAAGDKRDHEVHRTGGIRLCAGVA